MKLLLSFCFITVTSQSQGTGFYHDLKVSGLQIIAGIWRFLNHAIVLSLQFLSDAKKITEFLVFFAFLFSKEYK